MNKEKSKIIEGLVSHVNQLETALAKKVKKK